jgi:hypothetical protein
MYDPDDPGMKSEDGHRLQSRHRFLTQISNSPDQQPELEINRPRSAASELRPGRPALRTNQEGAGVATRSAAGQTRRSARSEAGR